MFWAVLGCFGLFWAVLGGAEVVGETAAGCMGGCRGIVSVVGGGGWRRNRSSSVYIEVRGESSSSMPPVGTGQEEAGEWACGGFYINRTPDSESSYSLHKGRRAGPAYIQHTFSIQSAYSQQIVLFASVISWRSP